MPERSEAIASGRCLERREQCGLERQPRRGKRFLLPLQHSRTKWPSCTPSGFLLRRNDLRMLIRAHRTRSSGWMWSGRQDLNPYLHRGRCCSALSYARACFDMCSIRICVVAVLVSVTLPARSLRAVRKLRLSAAMSRAGPGPSGESACPLFSGCHALDLPIAHDRGRCHPQVRTRDMMKGLIADKAWHTDADRHGGSQKSAGFGFLR